MTVRRIMTSLALATAGVVLTAEGGNGQSFSDDPRMPVNLAGAIAKAGIKTMIAYGGQDQTVPPSLNSELFIARLKAAGAEPIVKYRYAYGHHPHGMEVGERTIPDFFEIK